MKTLEILSPWRSLLKRAGLSTFEALWRVEGLPFKRKPDREILLLEVSGRRLFLKRYFRFGLRDFRCGAECEWWAARELLREGFSVPEPVAFGIERKLWPKRALSLFCEARGRRLEDLFREDPESFRGVLPVLINTAARFHALGFSHQDFYLCHLFWDGERLTLIDLQRVRRARKPRARWIIKDLAELFYSARNVLGEEAEEFEALFLEGYFREHPWLNTPSMLNKLEKKIRRIAAHDAKLKTRVAKP